jgi:hypothetical protein
MKGPKRLPHKHAMGPLQTARDPGFKSKLTRDRVRRWAKRVTRKDWSQSKTLIAARAFAKQETKPIRHLEDTRMPSFDFESSFENPKGPAVESFSTCSKVWEALNNFVFAEEGPLDD